MRWKLAAIVGLLAVTVAAVAFSTGVLHGGSAAAATSFLTATATQTTVTDQVTATGNVASTWTYDLAFGTAPTALAATSTTSSSGSSGSSSSASAGGSSLASTVTWPVTKLAVKVGDRVTKGQVLATASNTDLESQIADAVRSAKTASIQLSQAQTTYDNASGTQAVDQATIGLYNAQSAAARASTTLTNLKALRSYEQLVAPDSGIVTAVNVQAGSDAPSGTAIAMQSSALEVTTDVVESDVTKITLGQSATVTVAAVDATLNGTVASIAPTGSASGSNGVVQYAVQISLDAPPQTLRAGMSADVSIVTATATNVIAIPSRALSGSAGAYTVQVVAADGTVSTRNVTVGLMTSSLAEIQSGLQAGERVVTGTSSTQQTTTNRGLFGGGGGGAGVGGVGGVVGR